jgi:hypothetical protein
MGLESYRDADQFGEYGVPFGYLCGAVWRRMGLASGNAGSCHEEIMNHPILNYDSTRKLRRKIVPWSFVIMVLYPVFFVVSGTIFRVMSLSFTESFWGASLMIFISIGPMALVIVESISEFRNEREHSEVAKWLSVLSLCIAIFWILGFSILYFYTGGLSYYH